MKSIFSLSFFILLSIHLTSQVTIEGVLRLGDTSQVLGLETQNGDHFIGSISSWLKDTLTFQLGTDDLIRFHLEDVKKIEVLNKPFYNAHTDYTHGQFTILSKDGIVREGQLISMNQQGIRVKYMGNRRIYIRRSNLEEVVFDPYADYPNFENNYKLNLTRGGKIIGHLLHVDEEFIHFQPESGGLVNLPRSDVSSIYQRKGYRSVTGHQRALLLTPTGFNLRKGESEFRNIDYIVNSFSTGFNDHISGTVGLFGIEPYFQLKASYDFNPLLHVSIGGGVTLAGAGGWQAAASIGTPDQFINLGFMQSKGELTFEDTDMDAFFVGGSYRIGNRQRIIGEFTHLVERRTLFDANGFGTNTFAFAYGWFGRRVSLNLGLMLTESIENFCFGTFGPVPCDNEIYYFIPIPIISTSIFFGRADN